jgi:hypothetical protein
MAAGKRSPAPTEPQPSMATLEDWAIWDGDCEATDGCRCDPDGRCGHGYPSWLRYLGLL